MPLFEYKCEDCGQLSELLIIKTSDLPKCNFCDSSNLNKVVSAHSTMSGLKTNNLPGSSDTACCGSAPGLKTGCAGPGSCCGKI